jgi:hypothetical protein
MRYPTESAWIVEIRAHWNRNTFEPSISLIQKAQEG